MHLLGHVAAVINSGHQEHDTAFFSNEADIVISLINWTPAAARPIPVLEH